MKKVFLLIFIFYLTLIVSSYGAATSGSKTSSNYDKGASIIKKAKKLESKGKIEKANKRYKKALEYLIKSNEKNPNQTDTLNYLGFVCQKLHKEELEEKFICHENIFQKNVVWVEKVSNNWNLGGKFSK